MVSLIQFTLNGILHKIAVMLGEEQLQLDVVFLAQFQFFGLTVSGSYEAGCVDVP
jgi:hypothetical protein